MSQKTPKNKIKALYKSKEDLNNTGLKTANYQRELLMLHRGCKMKKNADVSIHFDTDTSRYAAECSDCIIERVS